MGKRTDTLIQWVEDCETLADIACDHGYIAIGAVLAGRANRAIACDINAGPLENARRHIGEKGLEERISVRLGSGFAPIKKGEAQQAVIAGIGGELAVSILQAGKEKAEAMEKIILQPQSELPQVRTYLYGAGYRVNREITLSEASQFYHVMELLPGLNPAKGDEALSKAELYYGKESVRVWNEDFYCFMCSERKKYLALLKALEGNTSDSAANAKEKSRDQIKFIEEVLRWNPQLK